MKKKPTPEFKGSKGSKSQGFQLSSKPVTQVRGTPESNNGESAVKTSDGESRTHSDIDSLGELPRSYGIDTIFLIAQEPHWLFTYWDIDISCHPGGKTFLRVYQQGQEEAEIEVPFETRNWYIPVKVSGGHYTVEIGYYRGSTWNVIAASLTAITPSEKVSDSTNFDYATIPLHISFQKLMESIQEAIQNGESFIQALSRLQKEGRLFEFDLGILPYLGSDRKLILEALLGKDLIKELTNSNLGSEEIEARIRKHLESKLSSEGASELFARFYGLSSQESSFFSAISPSITEGGTTSWSPAALSSWATAALSSWGALTSWEQGAPFSSFLENSLTSWGSSETVSSFSESKREFFMHVNAEVIFYGGTDPRAKVTICGKQIKLNPDGTFRYHFIFPEGDYEIPIVAESPDKMEVRKAVLRFERDTKKSGKVDDSHQPPLPSPLSNSF